MCKSSILEDFATILSASDVGILSALAHPDRLAIVESLLREPATQSELRTRLDLRSGTASKQLGVLEERRLVARRSSHGRYAVACPNEMLALIEAAAVLGVATSRQQAEIDEARQRAIAKLRMSRGAGMANEQDPASIRRRRENRS